jgi:hypothetical protein
MGSRCHLCPHPWGPPPDYEQWSGARDEHNRPIVQDNHPRCSGRWIRAPYCDPAPCSVCGGDTEWRHQEWPDPDERCSRHRSGLGVAPFAPDSASTMPAQGPPQTSTTSGSAGVAASTPEADCRSAGTNVSSASVVAQAGDFLGERDEPEAVRRSAAPIQSSASVVAQAGDDLGERDETDRGEQKEDTDDEGEFCGEQKEALLPRQPCASATSAEGQGAS